MNERIRELAEQSNVKPSYSAVYNPRYIFEEEELEKFAELIIEEMYCFMVDATSNDEPWPSFDEILEHFGVE